MVQCGIDAWEFPAGGKLFLPLNSWYLAGQKSFAKRFWMISCDDKCMLWMQSGSNWIQAFVKRLYIIFIAHCTISNALNAKLPDLDFTPLEASPPPFRSILWPIAHSAHSTWVNQIMVNLLKCTRSRHRSRNNSPIEIILAAEPALGMLRVKRI